MLQNEILSLLKDNTSVIIPELGAIMTKPGQGNLIFNEFLKFNDGLLVEHLVKIRGIDKTEASKEVKEFTNHVIKSLAKDQKCDLMPLGVLYIDENEKIQLKSILTFDVANVEIHKDVVNKTFINETPKTEEAYNPPKVSLLTESNKEAVSKPLKENNAMSENETNSKKTSQEITFDDDYYPSRGRTIRKMVIIIVVLIALVAAVIYFAFLKNPRFLAGNENVSVVAQTPNAPKASVSNADTSFSPIMSEINSSKNKFHIIAGAFIIEKNASAFMQELQKKGYDPKIVLKRGEYSFISIYSFPTFKEANQKYKTFEGSGMPVWIMRH